MKFYLTRVWDKKTRNDYNYYMGKQGLLYGKVKSQIMLHQSYSSKVNFSLSDSVDPRAD